MDVSTPGMDIDAVRQELEQMTRDDLVTFLENQIGNCLEPNAIKRSFLDDDDVDIFNSLFMSELISSSSECPNNEDVSPSRNHLAETVTFITNEVDDIIISSNSGSINSRNSSTMFDIAIIHDHTYFRTSIISNSYEIGVKSACPKEIIIKSNHVMCNTVIDDTDNNSDIKEEEEEVKVQKPLDYRYYRQKYHLKKVKVILRDIARQKVVMCHAGDKINRAQTKDKKHRSKASAAAAGHQRRLNYLDEKFDNVVLDDRGVRILSFEKNKMSTEDGKKMKTTTTTCKKKDGTTKNKLIWPVPAVATEQKKMKVKLDKKKIEQVGENRMNRIMKRIEESEKNKKAAPKLPLSYILPTIKKINNKKEGDESKSDISQPPPPRPQQQPLFNSNPRISSFGVESEKVVMPTQPIICIELDDDDDDALVEVHHVNEEQALKAVEFKNDDDDDNSSVWSDSSGICEPIQINGHGLPTLVCATLYHQKDGKVPPPPQRDGEEVDPVFGLIHKIAQWFLTNEREPFFQSTTFLPELEEEYLQTLAEMSNVTTMYDSDDEFDDDFELEEDHFGQALVEFRTQIRTGGTGEEEILGESKVGELILDQKHFKTIFKTERGRSYNHEQFKTTCNICKEAIVLQGAAQLAKHLNNFEHRENLTRMSLNLIGFTPPKLTQISDALEKEIDKETLNTEKESLEANGRWTWALEARWKLKEDDREALKKIHMLKRSKFVENKAEDHPLYNESWSTFWERRHTEICQSEGSFYADNHDYTQEWEIEWGKMMASILRDEFFFKLYEIHIRYGMDLTTIRTSWNLPLPNPADVFKAPEAPDELMLASLPELFVPPASLQRPRRRRLPDKPMPANFLQPQSPPVVTNSFPDPLVILDPRMARTRSPRPPPATSPAPRGFPLGQQQQHNRPHNPSPGQFRPYDPTRGRGHGRGQYRGYKPHVGQFRRHNPNPGQFRSHSSHHSNHHSNHRRDRDRPPPSSNFRSRPNDFKKNFSRRK